MAVDRFPWVVHRTLAEVAETDRLNASRWWLSLSDRGRLGTLTAKRRRYNPPDDPPPEAA